jgi:GT2 family glycosyltransferase
MDRALEAGADYVLVLNNDVFAEPSMVSELAALMEKHRSCAACQPLLLQAREASTIASAGVRLCLSGRAWDDLQGAPVSSAPKQSAPIAGATGGALFLRAEALRETGGFDPDYVMYFEDVDLSLRIRRRGHDIRLAPEARALHVGGATSARFAKDYGVQLCEANAYRIIATHFPAGSLLAAYPACLTVSILFCLYNLFRLRWGRAFAILKGALQGHTAMPALLFHSITDRGPRVRIKDCIEHRVFFPRL